MSYAEQIFTQKNVERMLWCIDLAMFGKEGYVYKNEDKMLDLIESTVVFGNDIALFYAIVWAKENGYNLTKQSAFLLGKTFNFEHSDYGTVTARIVDINNAYGNGVITCQTEKCIDYLEFDQAEMSNPDTYFQNGGNMNYVKSNIRQWLNSDAPKDWFVKQHDYDRAPSYSSKSGFLYGMDSDLVNIIEAVERTVDKKDNSEIHNGTSTSETVERFTDKIFIPSKKEITNTSEWPVNASYEKHFQYYASAWGTQEANPTDVYPKNIKKPTMVIAKKYDLNPTEGIKYLTRTPVAGTPSDVICISQNGQASWSENMPTKRNGIAPAFSIRF